MDICLHLNTDGAPMLKVLSISRRSHLLPEGLIYFQKVLSFFRRSYLSISRRSVSRDFGKRHNW